MNSDATCTDFNIQHMNYHATCVEIDMKQIKISIDL